MSQDLAQYDAGFLSAIDAAITNANAPAQETTPQTPAEPVQQQDEVATKEPDQTQEETPVVKSDKKGVDSLIDDEPVEPKKADDDLLEDAPEEVKSSEKQRNAWSAIKSEKKQLAAKVAELERQLQEKSKLQDADPLKQEAETYKKRVEELEKVAAAYDITKTAAYKNEVTKPLEEVGSGLEQLASDSGVELKDLVAAFKETDPKARRAALLSVSESMSEIDRVTLIQLNQRCLGAFNRQSELEENASQALEELRSLEQQQSEKQKTESKAAEMRAVEATLEKVRKAADKFAVTDAEKDSVVEAIAKASQESSFDELSVDDKAWAVVAANALPKMKDVVVSLRKEVAALKKEISGYAGSRASSGATQQNGAAKQADRNVDFLSAIGL